MSLIRIEWYTVIYFSYMKRVVIDKSISFTETTLPVSIISIYYYVETKLIFHNSYLILTKMMNGLIKDR